MIPRIKYVRNRVAQYAKWSAEWDFDCSKRLVKPTEFKFQSCLKDHGLELLDTETKSMYNHFVQVYEDIFWSLRDESTADEAADGWYAYE